MNDGVATGNWEYVAAAYTVTWTVLIGYAVLVNLTLWLMKRREQS